MLHRGVIAVGLMALCAWAAAPAQADFASLYEEYRLNGLIHACRHSLDDLEATLASVPADIQSYDPGFADALVKALEQRADGCAPGREETVPEGIVTAADSSPEPARLLVPAGRGPAGAEPSETLPGLLLGIGIVAAAVSIAVLVPLRRGRR